MSTYGDWEILGDPLGAGGQSTVYLVRSPARTAERIGHLDTIRRALSQNQPAELAKAISSYAREDYTSEQGALKVFRIREWGAPAEHRFKAEISVLRQDKPHLPKLLAHDEEEQWLVTEYFPSGTLDKSPLKYKGEPILALKAFRSLVETVANALHAHDIVHRDIKLHNVFIGPNGDLVPGDFGIAFVPESTRVTLTDERVGPWDYMPQWADLGVRLEAVKPNFDVYILGKLLWCMVAGRLRLPREYHRRPGFDLMTAFPERQNMHLINRILDRCIVEEPHQCLSSAAELLELVDKTLAITEKGAPVLDEQGKFLLPCRMCGVGSYQEYGPGTHMTIQTHDSYNRHVGAMSVRPFICSVCGHFQYFAPNFPDEAAKKGWKP